MHPKAFSLLEVVVATLVGGVVVAIFTMGFRSSLKITKSVTSRKELAKDCQEIIHLVVRQGRTADSCSRVSATEFQCRTDTRVPATADLTDGTLFRFIHAPSATPPTLTFQEFVGPLPTNWKDRAKFESVLNFDVCDKAQMAGACPIKPQELSTAHTNNAPVDDRFFRFRVRSGTNPSDPGGCEMRSAFFVRNPTPFVSNSSMEGQVTYQARMLK